MDYLSLNIQLLLPLEVYVKVELSSGKEVLNVRQRKLSNAFYLERLGVVMVPYLLLEEVVGSIELFLFLHVTTSDFHNLVEASQVNLHFVLVLYHFQPLLLVNAA